MPSAAADASLASSGGGSSGGLTSASGISGAGRGTFTHTVLLFALCTEKMIEASGSLHGVTRVRRPPLMSNMRGVGGSNFSGDRH